MCIRSLGMNKNLKYLKEFMIKLQYKLSINKIGEIKSLILQDQKIYNLYKKFKNWIYRYSKTNLYPKI